MAKKAKKSRTNVNNGRRGGDITKRLIAYGKKYVEQNKIDLEKELEKETRAKTA